MNRLTEDQTILLLIEYLKSQKWEIESYCLGQTRGYDIVASKNGGKMYVEAKGAKANDNSPTKRREFFNSSQLKTHLGKAIIKSLETKNDYPSAIVAIAHPNDEYIIKVLGKLIQYLKKINIVHYWVNQDGSVQKNLENTQI